MEQIIDIDKYEALQELLVREIIEQIRLKLMEAGLSGEQLLELTGNIAFSVTSTIDGNTIIEGDGMEVHPYLAFSGEDEQLIHCGENSFSHEFVAGIMEQVFPNQ
jgi:hypothetical protein